MATDKRKTRGLKALGESGKYRRAHGHWNLATTFRSRIYLLGLNREAQQKAIMQRGRASKTTEIAAYLCTAAPSVAHLLLQSPLVV